MYYSVIKDCDIANGEGVRITLFVSGCTNRCEHCFQPETWNFEYGREFTEDTVAQLLKMLSPAYIRGLTLLGGEPMEPKNQPTLLNLVKTVRSTLPNKDIWCFTGFTYEQLKEEGGYPRCDATDEFLENLDVLVDGRFVNELKNLTLRFRGSSNQRLIDMKKTLQEGHVVLLPDMDRKLRSE